MKVYETVVTNIGRDHSVLAAICKPTPGMTHTRVATARSKSCMSSFGRLQLNFRINSTWHYNSINTVTDGTRGGGVISPPPILPSLALLTWAICMECCIGRLDSRGRDRSREPCRIMTQHLKTVTESFPLSLCLLSLSLMRLSCQEISWSISLSFSLSPPSIKLLFPALSLSHSLSLALSSLSF